MINVVSSKPVLHRAEERGPRIGQVDVIECDGQRFEVWYWYAWHTGELLTIEMFPV